MQTRQITEKITNFFSYLIDEQCFFYYTVCMIGFFIKKNFVDGWDNLLWIALFNICILAWVALGFFSISATAAAMPLLSMLIILAFICVSMVLIFSLSDACASIANFKSVPISEVFANIKNVYKDGIILGLIISLIVFTALVGLPFYFEMYFETSNLVFLILGALIFWILLVAVLSFQWLLPLQSQMGGGLKKNIKKSFILFFDNTGFTIFLGFYTLFIFIFSALLAFMAPGITGVVLAHNNALRLRLYKYDWLEEHPELDPKEARRQIPWDELVADDKETIGPRDLKSFIFPWK